MFEDTNSTPQIAKSGLGDDMITKSSYDQTSARPEIIRSEKIRNR